MNVANTILLLLLQCIISMCSEIILDTQLGKIKGIKISTNQIDINQFLGIPYAQPPIGTLRFKDPADPEPWFEASPEGFSSQTGVPELFNQSTGVPELYNQTDLNTNETNNVNETVYDATQFKASCLQVIGNPVIQRIPGNVTLSEDCLYLNIYSPDLQNTTSPVLVMLHDGSWTSGSSLNHNVLHLANQGIVVVTIDYRLGLLGYFNPDDNTRSGKYGLKDQIVALKWIQKNINDYGGDRNDLTLVGVGAGAQATGMHLLNQENAGLFKKASVLSDSRLLLDLPSFSFEGILSDDFYVMKCNGDEMCLSEMNSSMIEHDINKLESLWPKHNTENSIPNDWGFSKMPLLIGLPKSPSFKPVPNNTTVTQNDVRKALAKLLSDDGYDKDNDVLSLLLLREYAPNDDQFTLYNALPQVEDELTSTKLRSALLKTAERCNRTYLYTLDDNEETSGSLFATSQDLPQIQKTTSSRLDNIIIDFVKSGNPGASLPSPANQWPAIKEDSAPFLELSSAPVPRITNDMKSKRPGFWDEYLPEIKQALAEECEKCKGESEPEPEAEPEPYFIATWVLLAVLILTLIILVIVIAMCLKARRASYDLEREGPIKL